MTEDPELNPEPLLSKQRSNSAPKELPQTSVTCMTSVTLATEQTSLISKDRSTSPLDDEGVEIAEGSVRRQTQEIEMKYIKATTSAQYKSPASSPYPAPSPSAAAAIEEKTSQVNTNNSNSNSQTESTKPSSITNQATGESAICYTPISKRWSTPVSVEHVIPEKTPVAKRWSTPTEEAKSELSSGKVCDFKDDKPVSTKKWSGPSTDIPFLEKKDGSSVQKCLFMERKDDTSGQKSLLMKRKDDKSSQKSPFMERKDDKSSQKSPFLERKDDKSSQKSPFLERKDVLVTAPPVTYSSPEKAVHSSNSSQMQKPGSCPTDSVTKEDRPKTLVGLQSDCKSKDNSEESLVSPAGSDTSSGTPAYKEEDITWSVGTVWQHRQAIESKATSTPPSVRKESLSEETAKYLMSTETLRLIREVGRKFMESSWQERQDLGSVKKIARQIEKDPVSSGKKKLIIVEKRKQTISKSKSVPLSTEVGERCMSGNKQTGATITRSSSFKENVPTKNKTEGHSVAKEGAVLSSNGAQKAVLSSVNQKENELKTSHQGAPSKDMIIIESSREERGTKSDRKGKTDLETLEEKKVKELVGIFEPSLEAYKPSTACSLSSAIKDYTSSSEQCKAYISSLTKESQTNKEAGLFSVTDSPPRRISSLKVSMTRSADSGSKSQSVHSDGKVTLPPLACMTSGQGKQLLSKSPLSDCSLPVLSSPPLHGSCDDVLTKVSLSNIKRPSSADSPVRPSSMFNLPTSPTRPSSMFNLPTSPTRPTASMINSPTSPVSSTSWSFEMKSPGACGINRVAFNPQREPDPSQVPRKSRKQQGKTHPLSKLTQEGSASPGRTPNPFYNTM